MVSCVISSSLPGSEGFLGGQAKIEGLGGIWKELIVDVNTMAKNLTSYGSFIIMRSFVLFLYVALVNLWDLAPTGICSQPARVLQPRGR